MRTPRVSWYAVLLWALAGPTGVTSFLSADVLRWDTGEVIHGTSTVSPAPNADLSELTLNYADFRGASLRGARFNLALLLRADFSGADLRGTGFTSAFMTRAVFTDSKISGASFMNATDRGFTKEQLYSTASWKERSLRDIRFSYNDVSGWDFRRQDLTGSSFEHAINMTGVDLANAIVPWVDLRNTVRNGFGPEQLYSTESYQTKSLQGVRLSNNNLSTWDFSGQDLSRAQIRDSSLTDSNFANALLNSTDLRTSNMSRSDLSGADLTGAFLPTTALGGAKLNGARLVATVITRSLRSVDLRGANLANSDLSAASLTGALFDDSTVYNQWTKFPVGFDAADAGLTLQMSAQGDVDANGMIDVEDVDLLMRGIRSSGLQPQLNHIFDLNGDLFVGQDDLRFWLENVASSSFGDANLDGRFNSNDLALAFSEGLYESPSRVRRANWASGDWNADRRFTSADLVLAIAEGNYEATAPGVANRVPEPSTEGWGVYALILFGMSVWRHQSS